MFNSWTASSLTGSWTPLATPFLAASNVTYNHLPWRIGLATQTNSTC